MKWTSNHLRGLLLLYKRNIYNIYISPINIGAYRNGIELIMQIIHHANNTHVYIIIPIIIVRDQSRERILYEYNKLLWLLKYYYYECLPSNEDKQKNKKKNKKLVVNIIILYYIINSRFFLHLKHTIF